MPKKNIKLSIKKLYKDKMTSQKLKTINMTQSSKNTQIMENLTNHTLTMMKIEII